MNLSPSQLVNRLWENGSLACIKCDTNAFTMFKVKNTGSVRIYMSKRRHFLTMVARTSLLAVKKASLAMLVRLAGLRNVLTSVGMAFR